MHTFVTFHGGKEVPDRRVRTDRHFSSVVRVMQSIHVAVFNLVFIEDYVSSRKIGILFNG